MQPLISGGETEAERGPAPALWCLALCEAGAKRGRRLGRIRPRGTPLLPTCACQRLGPERWEAGGAVFSSLRRRSGSVCLSVLAVCSEAFSCRGAHVERRGADSYSCCHLSSRGQFQELMASHPANQVDAACVRVHVAGASHRLVSHICLDGHCLITRRGKGPNTPCCSSGRGLVSFPSPGNK